MDIKNINFLFSENPNPMWIYDPSDLSIKKANDSACKLYGYSEDELESMTIEDLRPESEHAKLKQHLSNPSTEFNNAGNWKHRKKGGDIIFVRVLSSPISHEGKTYRLVTVQDVTGEIHYQQEQHMLFENSLDGIMLTSPDGSIYRVNEAACDILGMTEEEIIRLGREGLVEKDEKLHKALKRRDKTGRFSGELTFIGKSGRRIPVELTTSVYTNPQGEPRTSMIFRDITERKETEQKLRDILEHSTNLFYRHDTNHVVTYLSPQAEAFLGYNSEEARLRWTEFATDHPANKEGYKRTQKAIDTGQVQPPYPLELRKKNGEKIWVRVNEAPVVEQDKTIAMVGSLTDITEQRQYEERLQESLERYHYVTKATDDAIYDWDIEKDRLHLGEGFNLIFGYDIDLNHITLEEYTNFVHPDDHREAQKDLDTALADPSRNQWEYEYRFKKSDGDYAHVIENGYIIRDEDGVAIRMIGAIRDVTEQRKLEELLEEAQRLAQIGAWEVDLVNNELYWSTITKQIHEVAPDFTPDLETAISFYKEGESRETIKRVLQEAIEKEKPWDLELELVTAKGNEKWVRAIGRPEIADGTCTRIYGSFQDIHDRKQAQVKMQQANEERRQILERINDAFFAVDRDWTVTYWNKQAEEVSGVPQDEIIGENLWEKFPEAKELKFYQKFQQAISEQVSVQFEEYFPPLQQWFEASAYPSQEGLSVFFRDVTDRKETEKSLRDVHRRNRLILESTEEGIYGIDTVGLCTFINKAAARMLGYEPEECLGKNMHQLIHHRYANGSRYPESECPIFVAKNKREGCRVIDEVFWRANGSCFEVEYISNPMIEDGEIKGAVVVFSDITERNRKQRQIRLAKERYDVVAKATSDTIWDLDLENDTIEYNSNIHRMFGYETQQVQNVAGWWRDKIHPNDRPAVLAKIDKALETDAHRFQMEYRFQAADGSYKYIYDRAFVVTDENDKPLRVIGAMQDITERKKAELKLVESYKEKETILESIEDGFFTINKDWIVTYWNSAAERMLETPKEAILGNNLWEVFNDAVDLPSYENYHRVMEEGVSINFEDYYPPLQRWYNVSAYPSSEGITVYVQEITEQKKKETQLRESLAEKETLLQEIHHRVKNNLAVVSGMMQLQAFEETDENLKQKLNAGIGRIRTMGSIHELLYQTESFSKLEADRNIKKLVTEIVQTFQPNVELDLRFDLQKISLNINQAIPFSLIINEVVTNVLKHAFDNQEQGTLSVTLTKEDNFISFQVADNGKGLPPDFTKFEPKNSLGMQLIETLSNQLKANYSYRTVEEETHFTLTFEKANVKGTGNSLL